MPNYLSISPENLSHLNPNQAVEFFELLLWAEARRVGIPINNVDITRSITIPDGGIDATINDVDAVLHEDLIKNGLTVYQVKSGSSFKPWNDNCLREELFGKKSIDGSNLSDGMRQCLDKNCTYVLVLFGVDPTPINIESAKQNYKTILDSIGYTDCKIEICGQSKILAYLDIFPSLKAKLSGRGFNGIKIHESWESDADMRFEFFISKEHIDYIESIQNNLRNNEKSIHIRILGEPGIGKTRLVFEATKIKDILPLVLYCENPNVLFQSSLLSEITMPDSNLSAIIIVDECDSVTSYTIWNQIKYCGPRIKLITIYNEYKEPSTDEILMEVPILNKDVISQIIKSYGEDRDQAERWAEFCENSPRVAHVIGQNLRDNPDDLLKIPGNVDIWGRFLSNKSDTPEKIQNKKRILEYLSIFKRFGFGKPVINEAQLVHKLINEDYPNITWAIFTEIIEEFKSRKILQGENTLYITPKAFHIWLWREWWNIHGNSFDLETFTKKLSPKLKEWFNDMFRYADGSENVQSIIKDLLSENGPFSGGLLLQDEQGGNFFLTLTEANPSLALDLLEKTIGTWDEDKLFKFNIGRRQVIWSLEKIAVWKSLFLRSAKLLLKLAEAENDKVYSNNATGVFTELFTLGPNNLAPTEAEPSERFELIKEKIKSDNSKTVRVIIKALDKSLDTHISRMIGAENQGLKIKPTLWSPTTNQEILDAYKDSWYILEESTKFLKGEELELALRAILDNASILGKVPVFSKIVLNTLKDINLNTPTKRNDIIDEVIHVLYYGKDTLTKEDAGEWEDFKNELVGNDFHSQLNRYIGLDLIEDRLDSRGDNSDKIDKKIDELAKSVIAEPSIINDEFSWLVTHTAKKGYIFGYKLGKIDNQFSLLLDIKKAFLSAETDKRSLQFLGGYAKAMNESNKDLFEKEISELAKDPIWQPFILEIVWRAGVSDYSANIILDLAQDNKIDKKDFSLFGYGLDINSLSEDMFQKWINLLISTDDAADIKNALNLFHLYYSEKKGIELPKDLALKIITHDALFKENMKISYDTMGQYEWGALVKLFINKYPEESIKVAEKIIKNLGNSGSVMDYNRDVTDILNEISAINPDNVWKLIIDNVDEKGFFLKDWLRGGELFYDDGKQNNVLALFDLNKLWEWVDKNVENRAWYVASFAPKYLEKSDNGVCLARELLIKYGDRDDVGRNLMSNFSTEGWSGPASLHYKKKKDWLLEIYSKEDNKNVKNWIEEYMKLLDKDIDRSTISEERGDY